MSFGVLILISIIIGIVNYIVIRAKDIPTVVCLTTTEILCIAMGSLYFTQTNEKLLYLALETIFIIISVCKIIIIKKS